MNALNLTSFCFDDQPENKCIPLYPVWLDYEERKKELRKMNLLTWEYEVAIRDLATELNL